MPRLRQVSRDEANDDVRAIYQRLFGDRGPVAQPGAATGNVDERIVEIAAPVGQDAADVMKQISR